MKTWTLGAALAVSVLAGCNLDLTGARCQGDENCPQGQVCAASGLCVLASSTEPRFDGGSATDAGAADAGLPDAGPATDGGACDPSSCASGCCQGGACVAGSDPRACGSGGTTCTACATGEGCVSHQCSSCAATCTTGCCVDGTCTARSPSTCAPAGNVCQACGAGANGCSAAGECICGNGRACSPGQRCSNGTCVCDSTTCPTGCCSATNACVQVAGQGPTQCGSGGARCSACDDPPAATCSSPTIRHGFESPGTCAAGMCTYRPHDVPCAQGCTGSSCVNDSCQGCLIAPTPGCLGNQQRTFLTPGDCDAGTCFFAQTVASCPFGCSAGACLPDTCAGVTCNRPPPSECQGTTQVTYLASGSCAGGSCSYASSSMSCGWGCAQGRCLADPCAGIGCRQPPAASCVGNALLSWVSPGACSADGGCSYASQQTTCLSGCDGGQCLGDACAGITCSTPPVAICLNGTTRRSYAPAGTCAGGGCSYGVTDTACPFGCLNQGSGATCAADPCLGVACTVAPPPTCRSATEQVTFSAPGSCSGGVCAYASVSTACSSPPTSGCLNGTTLRSFSTTGACDAGACTYASTDTACQYGCANNACNTDPCSGVNCSNPPAPSCLANGHRQVFQPGACMTGSCSYPVIDDPCNNPPAPTCAGSVAVSWSPIGCSSGVCGYTSHQTPCASGCTDGVCNGDPCSGVSCTVAPANDCLGPTTVRTWSAPGTCTNDGGVGSCVYPFTTATCTEPPAPTCENDKQITYASTGTCAAGTCSYVPSSAECAPFTCGTAGLCNDTCSPEGCSADCQSGNTCRNGACIPLQADGEACASNCDCTSNSCQTFYRDGDQDDWGDNKVSVSVCGATPPSGYVVNDGDCCDASPEAHPKQTQYFSSPLSASECAANFDYDCDGTDEPEYTALLSGTCVAACTGFGNYTCTPGYKFRGGWGGTRPPSCGDRDDYLASCELGRCTGFSCTSCTNVCVGPVTRTQACR